MTATYPEPLICAPDLPGAMPLAGGPLRFAHVRLHHRDAPAQVIPAADLDPLWQEALRAPRAPLAGQSLDRPRVMGIVNTTPDSFSDGGQFHATDAALAQARALADAGADILDIGGESTRPGAAFVSAETEADRTLPVIAALRAACFGPLISIDTRKAAVARAATAAGAGMINDVSAMGFDPDMAAAMAATSGPVCLMHAQGAPDVMQKNPSYSNVVLDVFDALRDVRDRAIAAGIAHDRIVLDPGIGFGKTQDHNLALLRHLPLLHALGCPVLLGVSRKRFIGTLTGVADAGDRLIGSVALALMGAQAGVQILRVHDVLETCQALTLRAALSPETQS